MTIGIGIHYDLPEAEYHAIPAIGYTTLALGRKTMRHMHAAAQGRITKDETASMDLGTLFDRAITENGYADRIVITPDFGDLRRKEGKDKRDAWVAQQPPDAAIVTAAVGKQLCPMLAAWFAHARLSRVVRSPERKHQVTMVWVDKPTGLLCKGRIDVLHPQIMLDVKSARDASPRKWTRDAATYGYFLQAAHYREGYETLTGKRLPFAFAVVETGGVDICELFAVDQSSADMADLLRRNLLNGYAICQKRGEFPAYTTGEVNSVIVPNWGFETGEVPHDEQADSEDDTPF
jgi:hypothetical protein